MMLILEIMALLKIKEVENFHFLLQHVGGIVLYLKNQKKKEKKENILSLKSRGTLLYNENKNNKY